MKFWEGYALQFAVMIATLAAIYICHQLTGFVVGICAATCFLIGTYSEKPK